MTDNEIIKALEEALRVADETINRQKAEIERLEKYNTDVAYKHYNDGAKEFAKRFEKKIKDVQFTLGQAWELQCALKDVLKEMVGE